MNTTPISSVAPHDRFFAPRPAFSTAASLVGAATASAFLVWSAFVRFVARSDSWIFFFLVTKPLFDLTWRWRFFDISEQGVNIQTFVGLMMLGLSVLAIASRASWRQLPSRVLLFLGCACLSVAISPSSWGINELLRLLTGTVFFYLAGPLLAQPRQFDRFAKALLAVTSLPVLLSFLQVAGVLPYDYWDWLDGQAVGRASGTYNTPLGLVYLFIYTIPIALYLATSRKQTPRLRRCAKLYLLAAAVSTAFTYHRMGYVAIASGTLIWLYLHRGWKPVLLLVTGLLLVALLSAGFLKVLFAPLLNSVANGADYSSDEFLRGRGYQWYLFLNSYVSAGPLHWLVGLGGSVIHGMEEYDPELDLLSPNEAHSDYIRILHAYGIAGLLLHLSVLTLFLRKCLSLLRSNNESGRVLAAVVLPALASIAILSFTVEPMRYPSAVLFLFALASALFCVEQTKESAALLPATATARPWRRAAT